MYVLPLITAGLVALSTPVSQQETPVLLGGKKAIAEIPSLSPMNSTLDSRYQIGSEWGKLPIVLSDLEGKDWPFRRASLAAARTGGGTGFYLGTFAGHHVMATNHHVYPRESSCRFSQINFPLLNVRASCAKYLGTWNSIDLTLFTVRVSEGDVEKLEEVAANFAFDKPILKGDELVTAGFGTANNRRRRLMVNADSDCKVFSKDEEYRLMADPDDLNPGPYKAWSFANGCDVSHGDSGSAMVNRETGEVVGIIWTGRIPKSTKVQDSRCQP